MLFPATSRVFYPYQKRGVRIRRHLFASSKKPVNIFTGADTFFEACSAQSNSFQSTSANARYFIVSSTMYPSSTRIFSTCRMDSIGKAQYDRLRLDPDAYRAQRDRQSVSHKESYYKSPDVREKRIQRAREYRMHRDRANKLAHLMSSKLGTWLYAYKWIREALPWKSHQPLVFDKQVKHYCDSCHYARRDGARIWWRAKPARCEEISTPVLGEGQANSYLCHSCYSMKRDWSAVMPEGYEDVETLNDMTARKKELDGTDASTDMSMDDSFRRRATVKRWCHHNWVQELPWPTHQPLLLDQKTELGCATCDRAKYLPMKFWWASPTGEYLCNGCYTKPAWSEIMPRGYEDIRSFKDLVARKRQLDQLASGHVTTEPRYLCPHCYYSSREWSEVMPRGYEDVQTAKELMAHKKQLEQSHTAATNPAIHAASSPLRSTLSRPGTKKVSSHSSISSRSFSSTSANNKPSKTKYDELRSDPEAWRAYSEERAMYAMKLHDENAKFREHKRRSLRHYYQSKRNDPVYRTRMLISELVMRYPWSRTGLPWKLYRPVVTPQPVEHCCSGCQLTRRGGSKLWWYRTLAGSDVFLCHGCFSSKEGWVRAMPDGYEDVTTLSGFAARKKQLVGLDDGEDISGSESFVKANKFNTWCRQHLWFRRLPWKNHNPFLTEERVEDHCARCRYNRHRRLRLWWRSKDETICNSCYTNGEWKDIMPQGYEDVKTLKEIRARKEELEKQESKR